MNRHDYEKEIARLDSDPDDILKGTIVKATFKRDADRRSLFSLRIGADELSEISRAAISRGQNISEFIRNAALQKARQTDHDLPPPVLEAVDELVKRYQEAKQANRPR